MQDQDIQVETINSSVQIDVPWRLVQEVPEEVRAEPDQLEVYLIQAIEIGIKAIAQAGINLDTDFVRAEFPHPGLSKSFGRWSNFAGHILESSDHLSGVANISRRWSFYAT